ncbi:hypothetical protein AB0C42_22390 [Micromonospora taraxaci]|uniref:hypothetical protein n=1 Tax=Micromonospora taraxaci TaxID=1316803 RepID=UPI0033C32AA1
MKSIALAAAVAGVLATAPAASAARDDPHRRGVRSSRRGNFYVPMFVTKVTWQPRTC